MSLLWSVIKREDSQKRPTDFFGTTKGSSSVYFKATKVGVLLNCCVISSSLSSPPSSTAFYKRDHRNSFAIPGMILGLKEFLKDSYELKNSQYLPTEVDFPCCFCPSAPLPDLFGVLLFLWGSVNNCCRANHLWIFCTFHRQQNMLLCCVKGYESGRWVEKALLSRHKIQKIPPCFLDS